MSSRPSNGSQIEAIGLDEHWYHLELMGRPASLAFALLVALGGVSGACATAGSSDDARPGPDGPSPIDDAAPADAPAPDAAPAPCTGGDVTIVDPATGHCYRLYLAGQDWESARSLCAAFGADTHLVTINDAAENALVLQLGGSGREWIGLTDAAAEMQWTWITGEATGYTNWESGEPNDDGTEDCAELRGDRQGEWNDIPCSQSRDYVCERE